MQGVTAVEWAETTEEQGPEALLESLHCLRVAITIFDADSRLIFANAHLNHIFRKLPPAKSLIGKFYEELVVLELPGTSCQFGVTRLVFCWSVQPW